MSNLQNDVEPSLQEENQSLKEQVKRLREALEEMLKAFSLESELGLKDTASMHLAAKKAARAALAEGGKS